MKKILVILIVLIGFGLSANAQCTIKPVKNVYAEWRYGGYVHHKAVRLYNGNDYAISVSVEVTFVHSDGSKKTVKELFTLKPNSYLHTGGKDAIVDSKWSDVDCEKSTVKMTVF